MMQSEMQNRIILFSLFFLVIFGLCSKNAAAELLVNPGFESGGSVPFRPTTTGIWANDWTDSVTAENGITPLSGSRMLRFLGASQPGNPGTFSTGSEPYQLIDLTPFSSEIATGKFLITASAWFNRVEGDSQTDTQFQIGLSTYDGVPSDFPTEIANQGFVSDIDKFILSDGDVGTWEQITIKHLIPIGTDYMEFNVNAWENIFNDSAPNEFDGHYADNASVTYSIIPEPSSFMLLSIGGIALVGYGWRRKRQRIA